MFERRRSKSQKGTSVGDLSSRLFCTSLVRLCGRMSGRRQGQTSNNAKLGANECAETAAQTCFECCTQAPAKEWRLHGMLLGSKQSLTVSLMEDDMPRTLSIVCRTKNTPSGASHERQRALGHTARNQINSLLKSSTNSRENEAENLQSRC